jgi:enoyl-CoA hydratase/carnithine racemase
MTFSTILLEKKDGIAYLTLNRPEKLNGLSMEMMHEILQVLSDVQEDQTIKALTITGSGRAFSVGADINLLTSGFKDPRVMRKFLETINEMFFKIESLPIPVIASVNGIARAGGFELILSCDLVLISDDAKIGDIHTKFGVMPGGGATQRGPRKIGMQHALELIYTSKWLTGREAVDYGIALRSAPMEEMDNVLEELLNQLRDKSRDGLGYIKRAAMEGANLPLRDGVNLEIRYFMELLQVSPDPKEGFTSYTEKRKPTYAS